MDEINEKRWHNLLFHLSDQFADGDELEIDGVLFLIGVQELGIGYKKFAKKDKQDILHIAICTVLEREGYYRYIGRDEQGWPHFEQTGQIPVLQPLAQEALMKKGILKYFEERNYP